MAFWVAGFDGRAGKVAAEAGTVACATMPAASAVLAFRNSRRLVVEGLLASLGIVTSSSGTPLPGWQHQTGFARSVVRIIRPRTFRSLPLHIIRPLGGRSRKKLAAL